MMVYHVGVANSTHPIRLYAENDEEASTLMLSSLKEPLCLYVFEETGEVREIWKKTTAEDRLAKIQAVIKFLETDHNWCRVGEGQILAWFTEAAEGLEPKLELSKD